MITAERVRELTNQLKHARSVDEQQGIADQLRDAARAVLAEDAPSPRAEDREVLLTDLMSRLSIDARVEVFHALIEWDHPPSSKDKRGSTGLAHEALNTLFEMPVVPRAFDRPDMAETESEPLRLFHQSVVAMSRVYTPEAYAEYVSTIAELLKDTGLEEMMAGRRRRSRSEDLRVRSED